MKNSISVLTAFLVLAFVSQVNAQNPRPLWRGDAYVGGDFDVRGPNGITGAEAVSATTTVKAATFVAGASEIEINIPSTSAVMDGYGLIYDATRDDITLQEIPSASVSSLNDVGNVSVGSVATNDLIRWNGAAWVPTDAPTLDGITFDRDAGETIVEGFMAWNATDGVPAVGLTGGLEHRIGEDTIILVNNNSGSTISTGEAVKFTGVVSANLSVSVVSATDTEADQFLGLAAHDITNGATGFITTAGIVRNASTSAFTGGDVLYLSETTPGGLQTTVPTAPNAKHRAGIVVFSDASAGAIDVAIDINRNFDNLSNVDFSAKNDGEVPYWNAGASIWETTPQATGGGSGSVAALDDIGNVSTTNKAANDLLQWDGANWSSDAVSDVISALNLIGNVDVPSPSNDEVLTYNSASGNWEAAAGGGGSGQRTATFLVAPNDARDSTGADYTLNGTTDADSFAEMFDLLNTAGGGRIFVLDGTVVAERVISVTYSNISIVGSGPRITTFQRGYDGASVNDAVLAFKSGGDSAGLYNLGIDGESATYTTATNTGLKIDRVYNGRFQNLFVTDNAGDGMLFDGAGGAQNFESVFSKILFTANGGDGAEITAADECIFEGLFAFDNTARGLNFSSANDVITIDMCVAANNGTDGFFYSGSDGTLSGCNAYSNGEDGFQASASANGFTLTGCNASSNTGDGIQIANDGVLSGCVADSNGVDGIVITGSGNTINGCHSFDNTDDGIAADSTNRNDNTITNNNIQDNGGDGINLFNSSRNYIGFNRIYSNDVYGIYTDDQTDTHIVGNFIQDNTTRQMFLEDSSQNCYQMYNTFVGNNASNPLVEYDDIFATNSSVFAFNVADGEYSVVYTYDTVAPKEWATVSDHTGRGETMILASDVDSRIGIATEDVKVVSNVIWVDTAATTNPIADSWDTHSDPALKENIEIADATDEAEISQEIDALEFIRFDWKFRQPEPARIDYNTAEEYQTALDAWKAKKSGFETLQIKRRQLSLDITDPNFPPELGSYDKDGNRVGINTSQLINRMALMLQRARRVIKNQNNRISTLESAGQNLAQRIKALEDAVFGQ